MYKEKDMAREVVAWAEKNDNVRTAILTSTRTNPHASVDILSDYDIELAVHDFQPFLDGDEWLATFGEVMVRQPYKPKLFDDGKVIWRLVMFKDAPRIDFHIQYQDELEEEIKTAAYGNWDMGYKVLLDKDGITQDIASSWQPTYTQYWTKQPTESEYETLTHHFWWNITYVAKGLYRDELFFAKYMLDGSLHHKYLQTAIAWYIGMKNNWQSNPGALGRWIKKQVDPQIWSDIEATFAGVDFEENWNALFKTADVFGRLTSEVGAHLGYTYPADVDRDVTAYLKENRGLCKMSIRP